MAIGPRLDLRQSQSLVMTPQLQQAIRLLALKQSRGRELHRRGDREVIPCSKAAARRARAGRRGVARPPPPRPPSPCPKSMPAAARPRSTSTRTARISTRTAPRTRCTGPRAGSAWTGWRRRQRRGGGFRRLLRRAGLAPRASPPPGRRAALGRGPDRRRADHRADRGDGLFRHAPDRPRPGARRAARRRRTRARRDPDLDPAGIAARSLAECLALQAKDANRYDPAMARLIDNLDYLARGNVPALKRICGVDDEDMADMIRELRAYDPKPGCRFMAATGSMRSSPTSSSRGAAPAGRSSSTLRPCRGCSSTGPIIRSWPAGRRIGSRKPGSTNACKARTG